MTDYKAVAGAAARKYKLDPVAFTKQIGQESGYNPNAHSPAGAVGIAQIMPATAKAWHVNPNDPNQSIDAAASHMAGYVKQFGSLEAALRAYNAGPGAVEKSKGYAETNNYVKSILGNSSPSIDTSHASTTTGSIGTTPETPSQPSVYDVIRQYNEATAPPAQDQTTLQSQMDKSQEMLMSALDRGSTDSTVATPSVASMGTTDSGSISGLAGALAKRANEINSKQLPYLWGGGHGSKVDAKSATPLDCSGAVSAVLGIDPRVSGDFVTWGKPGAAKGGKGTTVYANDHHVLMEIDGHFFGTSRTNPGGGAGWIPRAAISPEYLKGFTARHL